MKHFKFIKLSDKWFIDIPWDGDVNDLQMVDGSDLLLDCYNKYGGIVRCSILEGDVTNENDDNICILKLKTCDFDGATYEVNSKLFKGDIWLCRVLDYLFGGYPNTIKVKFD